MSRHPTRLPWPFLLLTTAATLVLTLSVLALASVWRTNRVEVDQSQSIPSSPTQTTNTPSSEAATDPLQSTSSATPPGSTSEIIGLGGGEPVVAELSDGEIVLSGNVPSAGDVAQVISLAESVVGEGNVTSSLTIDETTAPVDRMSVVVADQIVFAPYSAELEPRFLPTLDQIIDFMRLDPSLTMVVRGHTDSAGDDIENLALSQRRAEAVVAYAVEQGINPSRLDPQGRGSREPIADNSTPEGRERNRRLEFDIGGLRMRS
jgi:outer membrane protein OmpA-like peptidoglycan-associated protein